MADRTTPLAVRRTFRGEWQVVKVNKNRLIIDKWPLAIESAIELDVALDKAAWLDTLLTQLEMTRDQLADQLGVVISRVDHPGAES